MPSSARRSTSAVPRHAGPSGRPAGPSGRLRTALRRRSAAPPLRLFATEAPRAALEFAALTATLPLLAADRKGDGHSVLVLPGLFGGDLSTLTLRSYLSWLGYSVSGWELGTNVGASEAVVSGLRTRLAEIAKSSGRQVSVVGWSLGGLYAHELARSAPGSVRQVITLGSPVRLNRRTGRTTSRLFDRFSHLQVAPTLVPRSWVEAGTLRVPATSVYTRSDGVVAWWSCQLEAGKNRENVQVRGSHYGLAHNPTVLHLLADRLAQPEGTWAPFRPSPVMRHAYP